MQGPASQCNCLTLAADYPTGFIHPHPAKFAHKPREYVLLLDDHLPVFNIQTQVAWSSGIGPKCCQQQQLRAT